MSKIVSYNFVEKARKVHGDKYDYSKVEYINNHTKVCIICPIHGEFWQIPLNHLRGQKCPICSGKAKMNKQSFAAKAKKVHGDKYDYSKVNYINNSTKVCIICPIHGEFWVRPHDHLNKKSGCPFCAGRVNKDKTVFIRKVKEVHGDRYDYSKSIYINANTKIEIICKDHGSFWQTPANHINLKQDCPHCNISKGENRIKKYLKENNIEYISQYGIVLPDRILFARNNLRIDFCLPRHNTFIEFNGIQHYEFSPYFHESEEDFQKQIERDRRLKEYCKKNKINLIVIKYNQIDKIDEILNKKIINLK